MPWTACRRSLKRKRLLDRMMTISDLDDSVRKKRTQCSVEASSVMVAATVVVQDDVKGV